MNIAAIKEYDVANGPGIRVSVYVSGCTHHCKGCFNEVAWNFNYGTPYTVDTEKHIINLMNKSYISGISILGGEPFENANIQHVCSLIESIRNNIMIRDKSIWCYSGYTIEQLRSKNTFHINKALSMIDVLVDGEFIEELKDLNLEYRGSSNQRIIHLKNGVEV